MVKTQIQVEKETRKLLLDLGRKGESYDDIIRRFLPLKTKQKKEATT